MCSKMIKVHEQVGTIGTMKLNQQTKEKSVKCYDKVRALEFGFESAVTRLRSSCILFQI